VAVDLATLPADLALARAPADLATAAEPSLANHDLHLVGADGKPVLLGPYLGERLTYVNLWATWCKPCRQELPLLSRWHARYRARGFRVIGISLDEDRGQVEAFLRKTPVTYRVFFGGKDTVAELQGATALPMTLVLDAKGAVLRVYDGSLPALIERQLVADLQ
jgi:thiol-disulfide isomerase/thioredoxin